MHYFILVLVAWFSWLGCGGVQSSGAYSNVPYCAHGNRAKGCIGSKVCSVTTDNCQVCRCEGLDD